MKEAVLYKRLGVNKVRCTACRQGCLIAEGDTGICGVRQNKDGKLYLLVYGKASAVNIDPAEKKPLFHSLPGSSIFSLFQAMPALPLPLPSWLINLKTLDAFPS